MTTYILAGGADKKYPSYATALAAEVRKYKPGRLTVLSCFFAEPREVWEEKIVARTEWFKAVFGNDTEVVPAFPDIFPEQINACDVVYVHGGDDTLLAHYLDAVPNLTDLWKNKIVIGSSAGADYLSGQYYWSCDWRHVRKGSGITSLNVIPHYESEEYGMQDPRGPIDWQAARSELQAAVGPDAEVHPLREGEFVVVQA